MANNEHEVAHQLLLSLDRRTLLKAAGGATVLAVAAALPGCGAPPQGALRRLGKLRYFRAEEGYVLERFAARVLPPHRGRPTIEQLDLVARLDGEIGWLAAHIDRGLGRDLKRLLKLAEYGPFFIGFLFRPFTRLPERSQDLYLRRWEQHRVPALRMAFRNLRALCTFFYFCDDRTWESIRYAGPWVEGGAETLAGWKRQGS